MTIYQSVTYTTEHCDGDLIPPSFWNPHTGPDALKQCAAEIISEIKSDLAMCGCGNLDEIYVEVREDDAWKAKETFTGPDDKRLDAILSGLETGQIDCIRVEQPEFVNMAGCLVESHANVYYVNSFSLGES